MENTTTESIVLPENFKGIVADFVNDLSVTFPEYSQLWYKWSHPEITKEELEGLYEYFINIFPERFFDILYQNTDIFKEDSDINTHFLPDVDFKIIFNCGNVSEKTHTAIWKYLQLILFTITSSIKQKDMFGETMNLFDGIDENDLQEKLNETMKSIGDFFSNIEEREQSSENEKSQNFENNRSTEEGDFEEEMKNTAKNMFGNMKDMPGMENFENMFNFEDIKKNMPNPQELHSHLKSLFDGKIGKLAKELAEELSNDLTGILEEENINVTSTKDVLKLLMKNPKKMMDFVKKISSKLEDKMKSGDFSHDDIMKEASELFEKMKGMGGDGKDLQGLMKTMMTAMGGMGGMGGIGGKGARMDMNAMSNNMKKLSMREKLKERMEKKKQVNATNAAFVNIQQELNKNDNSKFTFTTGEKQEKSSTQDASKYIDDIMKQYELTDEPQKSNSNNNKKSKGKSKGKK
jgi:hypothetical protein